VIDDPDKTPPVRAPSGALALLYSEECDADAARCDRIEIQAREIAREMRALAEMFRAWEHGAPGGDLKGRAYARLFDLRQRMKELGQR
jgi:hypothetical protein